MSTSRPRPRLSICLPTHHGRAQVLDRALRSIAAQLHELPAAALEVCVSDNGSHDATQDVLTAHRLGFGANLVTFRFEENQGFTPNLLKAVELARGDFCWLMGSDDEIEPGGITTVLAALDVDPDLSGLTVNRRNVDDARPEEAHADDPRVLPPTGRTDYTDAEGVFAELAMLQDYISTQVVRRERWNAAVTELGQEGIAAGLNFPHLPILGTVIRRAPRWRWISEPVIRHRIGLRSVQDSFDGGLTPYTITVTADRSRIWQAMFGRRSRLYRLAMRKVWLVQAHPAALIDLKQQPGQTVALDVRLLVCLVRAYWFLPGFWALSMPVLLMPHGLIGPVLDVVRRIKARLG
ncbi:MAG: glycosyltransferase family 2 protein [Solirubrobacteraceae bacterium]